MLLDALPACAAADRQGLSIYTCTRIHVYTYSSLSSNIPPSGWALDASASLLTARLARIRPGAVRGGRRWSQPRCHGHPCPSGSLPPRPRIPRKRKLPPPAELLCSRSRTALTPGRPTRSKPSRQPRSGHIKRAVGVGRSGRVPLRPGRLGWGGGGQNRAKNGLV